MGKGFRAAHIIILCILLTLSFCKKEPKAQAPVSRIQNVLIITIDTLRADALSIYGNKTRSPFFEQIASKSVVFDRAYTSAPITLPAHTSLFTGLYPPSHGVRNNGTFRASPKLHLLSEIAKQNGLSTAAMIGAFPLASRFGLNQGFDVYNDTFSATSKSSFLYAERNAEQVRSAAQAWLSRLEGKPFFLWLHLFDPHHPYLTHDSSSSLPPYLQEVQYVDQQLASFFDFLKSANFLSNTLVVIASDHGEAFGEHGEVSHSIFLYNTTLHIPLIIFHPGIPARRNNDVVRLIDVYPTILQAMNWTPEKVDGRSLLPLIQGQNLAPANSYAETLAPALDFGWSPLFAITTNEAKYIGAPKPELYNLKSDPEEQKNVIESAKVIEFQKELQAIRSKTAPEASSPALTEEDREKLKSLGYVSVGNQQVSNSGIDPKDRIEVARKIAELTMSELPVAEQLKAYKQLANEEPSNPLLQLRYAEMLLKLNRENDAATVFQKVISLNYPSATAYNGLATVYYRKKKTTEAQKLLETAVQKKIADGETYHNLAEFYFDQGLRDKAFQFLDESIRLDFLPAFFRKAQLLEVQGKTGEALQLIERAKSLHPPGGEADYHSGMIHFRHHKYAEAVRDFENALKKEPNAGWIHFNLGISYERLGNEQKAREAMGKFLRDGPPDMKNERDYAKKFLTQRR